MGDVRYDGWDDKASMGCVCDAGYEGLDCSSMKCPRGDDPLTKQDAAGDAQVAEIQTIIIKAGLGNDNLAGSYTLTYTDLYGSKWTTRPLRVRKTEAYATPDTAAWTASTRTLLLTHGSGNFNGFLAGDRISIVSDATDAALTGTVTMNHADHRVEHMKEALMTLPDNVIEDISVNYEGTFSSKLNTYTVTFVSPHNP